MAMDSSLRTIVRKRTAFVHDQEVRAVVWEPQAKVDGSANEPFGHKGIYIPVDVGELISEVVVSPLSHPGFVDTVRKVVRVLGFSFEVNRSTLLDPPSYRKPGVGP